MPDTDAFTSTQPTQGTTQKIFVDDDDSPIQIFAEPGGINNRPRLIRKLKSHGAAICTDPSSAQVILVNQDSSQGRHFIREWATDESKVVLHELWVKKCIEVGRILRQNDSWGGCLAHDNGSPEEEEQEEDGGEVAMPPKSPLPTPRPTPSEVNGTPSVSQALGEALPQGNSRPQDRRTMSPPLSQSPAISVASTSTNGMQQAPSIQPFNMMNGLAPFMQFGSQMQSMFNGANGQLAMPANMMSQQFMSNLLSQHIMSMMMQPSAAQFNPETFSLAMADAISKYASGSQPAFTQPTRSESPIPEPALPFPEVPSRSTDAGTSKKASWSTPASGRQRSPSESSDTPTRVSGSAKKGKKRATSPHPVKRRKVSATSYEESPASQARASSQRKIFQTKSGKELAFFVQIDMHNRFNLVDAIKKNGGRIEKEQELADYAVLYKQAKQQKTFKTLLASAQTAGKIVVPSRYIYDCVEMGTLLDPTDYEFEGVQKKPVMKRTSNVTDNESSDPHNDTDDEPQQGKHRRKDPQTSKKANTPKPKEEGKVSQKQKSSVAVTTPTVDIVKAEIANNLRAQGRRTPTPPPEHTRQPWGNGHKFSLEENQFALTYAELLIARDHTASLNSVCVAIHKKLPHHSLASWRTQFNRIAGDSFEQWRKRSSIAYRKALRESQTAPPTPIDPEPVTSHPAATTTSTHISTSRHVSSRSNGSESESEALYQDDLNIISRYFVQADDNEPEDALWAGLSAKYRCKTKPTWEIFYENHYEDVKKRHGEFAEAMGLTQ
ncbi:hypothetical protein D9613_001750 [Agrocybe pediades]|uniref:BRCT domain-containing protein n=1 Tax=Agrocybe pediades TaxID=84607 RepID=A0A8H4R6A7_9AGAR|nr:hypothetical protein D9613_001750 [Agrocybe pediades]